MQQYIVAPGGVYSHKVSALGNQHWDDTHFCPASALTPEEAQQFSVFVLTETDQPEHEKATSKAVEVAPVLVGEVWTQQWAIEPLTIEEVTANLDDAVEAHLDSGARGLGYKDMERASTYAASAHPKFGKEGKALVEWRSAVWDDCYAIMADVLTGVRALPTAADLIDELPKLSAYLAAQGL